MTRLAGAAGQIGHGPLALLIAAQAAVLLPHVLRISVWVTAVAVFAAAWRLAIYYGRAGHPPLLVKLALVVGGAVAVLAAAEQAFSVEPAVNLLIVAGALKLIEMANRRDAFIVILVAWFVAAAEFLFHQDILTTAYVGCAVTVVAAALVGLAQSEARQRPLRTLRIAAVMMLQAVPLAVVVFLFFPRVAPLWSVPSPSASKTGISDVIEPGAVARLANSSELAFRVAFDGPVPPRPQLYWRGLVYSHFEAGRWSQVDMPRNAEYYAVNGGRNARWRTAALSGGTQRISYEIVMEPTQRNWLFALATPVTGSSRTLLARDWRLATLPEVSQKFAYSAESLLGAVTDLDLPVWFRDTNLQLPADESPRARALATRLRAGSSNAADFVGAVLRMYREQPFVYTLSPGRLPDTDSVDAFLFTSQRGFCSHFAGSFVFLMRAGGVPARMIGGYQGGELNSLGGFVAVRQFDAHAWAEVWLSGQGWVRVDPTAQVAPERIEAGLEAALARTAERTADSPFDGLRLRDIAALDAVMMWFESMEFQWNVWVLGYDGALQMQTLERWFGQLSVTRLALIFGLLVGLVIAVLTATVAWHAITDRTPFAVRSFARVRNLLARSGVRVERQHTPAQLAGLLASSRPDLADLAGGLLRDLEQLLYQPEADAAALRARVRRASRRLWLASHLGIHGVRGMGRVDAAPRS